LESTSSEYNGRTESKYDTPGQGAIPVTRTEDKSGAILILSIVLAILSVVICVGYCIIKRYIVIIRIITTMLNPKVSNTKFISI
jgi:hypothetical protein